MKLKDMEMENVQELIKFEEKRNSWLLEDAKVLNQIEEGYKQLIDKV